VLDADPDPDVGTESYARPDAESDAHPRAAAEARATESDTHPCADPEAEAHAAPRTAATAHRGAAPPAGTETGHPARPHAAPA